MRRGVLALVLAGVLGCGESSEPLRPNVLLVVLDTVRLDRLSAYGYPLETSPHLSMLAREGARFDDVVSTSPWTLPSHASLFTGLSPSEHGATHEHRAISTSAVTLAMRLTEAGYTTAGYSTNPNVSSLTRLDSGFGKFEYWPGTGEEVTDRVLDFVDRTPEPWFVFANYMEAHMPYTSLSEEVQEIFLPGSEQEVRLTPLGEQANAAFYACGEREPEAAALRTLGRLYDASLLQLDRALGRLFEGLGELREHTLIVVLSDHGELLGEHDRVEHQYSLLDPLLRIPLIVSYPGQVPAGRTVDTPLDIAQVHDMILFLTGLREADGAEPFGVSARMTRIAEYDRPESLLEGLRASDPACADALDRSLASARTDRFKLVLGSDGFRMLADLSVDPKERVDVSAEHPDVVAELESLIVAQRRSRASRSPEDEPPPIDAAMRSRLKALGYLGSESDTADHPSSEESSPQTKRSEPTRPSE